MATNEFTPAFQIHQSLYGAFADAARAYPSNAALLYMGVTLPYRTVLQRVDRLAAHLTALSIGLGDTVTVCLPNIPDAVYWFYAISKVGATAHLVHPLTTPEQMRGCLEKVTTKLFVVLHTAAESYFSLAAEKNIRVVSCNPADVLPLYQRLIYNAKNKTPAAGGAHLRCAELLRAALPVTEPICSDGAPAAVYLHSGGTSGAPKTIALSARAVNALAAKGAFALGTSDVAHKVMLSVLPMFHGFGMCMGIHAMLCHGGCNAIMPKFNARTAVKLLLKNKLHFIIGVPILYEALMRQPKFRGAPLKNVSVAFVGGDFVSHTLLKKVDERFREGGGSARLFEGYGLTETVTVCAVNTLASFRDGSVGQPLPGLRLEAADDHGRLLPRGESGELYVTGDTLMTEYVGDAAATAETFFIGDDGTRWVKTGDYGYVDADGFVFFRQRIKRIVKVSGVSVYPFEIEQLVSEQEGVTAVCALDVPDARHGSMIQLFVATPETDAQRLEALRQTLCAQIRSHISVYALPRSVIFRTKLPTTNVGKINAEQLRAELRAQSEEHSST